MRNQIETLYSEFSGLVDDAYEFEIRSVPRLQIAFRKCGDVTIVDLRGRSTLNGRESDLLGSALKELFASGTRRLLLNLTDLTQLDSTGVSVIVRMFVSLRRDGGDLRFLRPGGAVLDVFNVLRLLEIIPSFADETQALASFRPLGYFAKPWESKLHSARRRTT